MQLSIFTHKMKLLICVANSCSGFWKGYYYLQYNRMVQDTQEALGAHQSIGELGEVSIRISACLYSKVLQVFMRKHAINKACVFITNINQRL